MKPPPPRTAGKITRTAAKRDPTAVKIKPAGQHKPAGQREPTTGTLELSFGAGQYGGLTAAGLLGMIPTTTWLLMAVIPLHLDAPDSPLAAVGKNVFLGGVAMVLTLSTILIAPWLVPCLVLRARQPHGARIEWDDVNVTEWDGEWKRTVIPWKNATASHRIWKVTARMRTITYEAVQLMDPATKAAITVWPFEPPGVDCIRRRLCSDDVASFRTAIEAHRINLTPEFDPSLAAEPHRTHSEWRSWIGRLGYLGGVIAPLMAGAAPSIGILIAAVSSLCLTLRAVTAVSELRALLASQPASADQRRAEDLRLRAVIAEVLVRGTCIVLVPISTAISAFVLPY